MQCHAGYLRFGRSQRYKHFYLHGGLDGTEVDLFWHLEQNTNIRETEMKLIRLQPMFDSFINNTDRDVYSESSVLPKQQGQITSPVLDW